MLFPERNERHCYSADAMPTKFRIVDAAIACKSGGKLHIQPTAAVDGAGGGGGGQSLGLLAVRMHAHTHVHSCTLARIQKVKNQIALDEKAEEQAEDTADLMPAAVVGTPAKLPTATPSDGSAPCCPSSSVAPLDSLKSADVRSACMCSHTHPMSMCAGGVNVRVGRAGDAGR